MVSQTGETPAWIITRRRYTSDEKVKVVIEMEEMVKKDIMGLELFSLQLFDDASGLCRDIDDRGFY